MASGGDRIIANLPPTFAATPRPTVLAAIIDAFGAELVGAENSLSAMMFSHWVDFADKDSADIADLAGIASLYGLAPRDDETIEGFRDHLKRYVRTFIDGTVTVGGIFRITAEALGLVIADGDAQLDTWWNRASGPLLTTIDASGDDAATALFGVASALVRGTPPKQAEFDGTVDLSAPVDVRGRSLLAVGVDGAAAVIFDLAPQLPDPAHADLDAIVASLGMLPGVVASRQGDRLTLRSVTAGVVSRLELDDLTGDAAPALLGIAPHDYRGAAARRAQIIGTVDLPASLDLSSRRYLRLTVDGTVSYKIDCAGADPAATSPTELVAAILTQAGVGMASLVGQRLALSSPTPGLAGTVALRGPTTGDATTLLLGDAIPYARGADAAPARASGLVDLSAGVDLSQRSKLMLAVDAIAPMIVDCAGPTPQKTLAGDIATAINAATGLPIATQNGATVTLTSHVVGPTGRVRLLTAPANDALDLIFGFTSRVAAGADASAAKITGSVDLSQGADLRALQKLQLALDDGTPATVDFAAAGLAKANASPADIVAAIHTRLGASLASTDGVHLALSSAAAGDQGAVAILPIETTAVRPFVSRAFPTDEASNTILGTFTAAAQGGGATPGSLLGGVDLHDGIDLRVSRYLRLAVDGGAPRDVDCASQSPRPRAALLAQIADAINQVFQPAAIASVATGRLVLTSPTAGRASTVVAVGGGGDASMAIFGSGPRSVTGAAAQRLVFTGLADLTGRVDLSTADRIKLAIDGAPATEIGCAGSDPARTSAAEIAGRINAALGGSYASTDGHVVRLGAAAVGSAGAIEFIAPSQRDATRLIFGIAAGRMYRGDDATPATLISAPSLSTTLDLSAAPSIRLAVDGGAPVLIDCRGADPAKTTPAEIATRIAGAFPAPAPVTAVVLNERLVVTSVSVGGTSRLSLLAAGNGDAGTLLLGAATSIAGTDATPAQLTGSVDLRTGVDLLQRSILRLAIDGGRSLDVDVAGAAPDRTFGDEIAAALNAAVPGLGVVDANGRLVLTSPTTGDGSGIDVLPLRPIEIIEYPPLSTASTPMALKNGDRFTLLNESAAESMVSFALSAPGGFCGADLTSLTTDVAIHVGASVGVGETLMISAAADGRVVASVTDASGTSVPVAPELVTATPLALNAVVPFTGTRPLAAGAAGTRRALALVDPPACNAVLLEAIASSPSPPPAVQVTEASASAASGPPTSAAGLLELLGRLRLQGSAAILVDASEATIAHVRASAGVVFAPFDGWMVAAHGQWYPTGPTPLLAVAAIARLFDVTFDTTQYAAVTIDARAGARSLAARLAAGGGPGVIARDVTPSQALRLPRGRSQWLFSSCDGSRFDAAHFGVNRFAGGPCDVVGIFDVSRFDTTMGGSQTFSDILGEHPRFAPLADGTAVTVTATWETRQPGAFTVNLPADLPEKFGAHFNAARFASQDLAGESYPGAVFEPPTDTAYLPALLPGGAGGSPLVFARQVAVVPLGWDAQTVPFTQPRVRYLRGGGANRPSAIYLQQPGLPGAIGLFAKADGAWGDQIAVTVRYAGPAMFDLTVSYPAARFESARAIVLAGRVLGAGEDPLPALVAQIIKPGPIGVVQAKAAGIATSVTRDRT